MLAPLCQHAFESRTIHRGEGYYEAGRVHITGGSRDEILARVRGSARTPYAVQVDLSELDRGVVFANCTCPYYKSGSLCKHIWAALRASDERNGTRQGGSGRAPGGVRVLRWDENEDEDEEGYGDEYGDEGEEEEYGDEYEDDEEEDFGWEALNEVNEALLAQLEGQRGRRLDRPPAGRVGGSAWRDRLKNIGNATSALVRHYGGGRSASSEREGEVWYVLDVTDSLSAGKLAIRLFERRAGRDGEKERIRPLNLSRRAISHLANEADRRLLSVLLRVPSDADSDRYWLYEDYYEDYEDYVAWNSRVTNIYVPGELYEYALPRLAATERFIWTLDRSLPLAAGRRVVWDGREPPWRFRVRVESDDRAERWSFRGELVRGEESVAISDAVLLLAEGAVLFGDRLARLDARRDFGWIADLRGAADLHVPYSARDELRAELCESPHLPEMELPESLRVERSVGDPRPRLVVESPPGRRAAKGLLARVFFVYGEHEYALSDPRPGRYDPSSGRFIVRDRDRESHLHSRLSQAGLTGVPRYAGLEAEFEFPQDRLPELVAELTGEGWIIEAHGVRTRTPGALRLSVASNVDWFELDGAVDFDGAKASLPRLLEALRNKESFVRLDDGTQGILPEEWLKRYGRLAELGETAGEKLRFAPCQGLLLDALLAEQEHVRVDKDFERFRSRLKSFQGVRPSPAPRGFHGRLRKYQEEGLGWLHFLRDFGFGGCLADDMGLGKTVQVLALLQSRRLRRPAGGGERAPSIVIAPKSLVFNWMEEAARFTPRLRVLNYTGLERKKRFEEAAGRYDVLLSTYGTLRRDIAALKEIRFDYAILDESQAIKNHHSQTAKAARLLNADHRLAMTGTPVENSLDELWSLFEFLNPGMLGRSSAFAALAKNNARNPGDPSVALLARAVRPFLLRRTKSQVLSELPEKTEQTLYCEMSASERKRYNELRDYYRVQLSKRVRQMGFQKAKIHVLEALLRLRQAACHPALLDADKIGQSSAKLGALLDQLQEVIGEGHKALVFSQFTTLLAVVRRHLNKRGIAYEYLDGRTRKRGEIVKRFQEDPARRLFLISLKAGGHGLNLTAADYVYILDPWWNPAVEAQAVDRAHRIGQTRRVFAYRIICKDTVEDKIIELQETKRELADAIVSADNSIIRKLTAEDLQMLLS